MPFVGRRVRDVAQHANCAAVHEPLYPFSLRRLEKQAGGCDVDVPVVLPTVPGLTVRRGQVINDR
jgi:hypothetical protein